MPMDMRITRIAVKDFLHPEAQYSTEHGVKGEEYDNVIFVISKGWNQYQFERIFFRQTRFSENAA